MNSFKDFTEFSKITLLMNNDNYLSYNLPSLYQKMEYISSVFSSALQPMAHLPDIILPPNPPVLSLQVVFFGLTQDYISCRPPPPFCFNM